MNPDNKIKPFIPLPRSIASDFKNGRIARNELILYLWVIANANPYGISTVSISALRDDIFRNIGENYVNKLLLSLRSKRYIFFEVHRGRRGSFEVKFGDFLTPDHNTTDINKHFKDTDVRSEYIPITQNKSEENQNLEAKSQKLEEKKRQLHNKFSFDRQSTKIRTNYNDKENDN